MKILLVLMCYINHLSGYISYFDTGYWLMKHLGSKVCCDFHPILLSLEFAGKTEVFLPGTWIPLLVLNEEVFD
jgi:hypothetical protein